MPRRLLFSSVVVFVVTTSTVFAQSPESRYGGRVSWVNASAISEGLGDTDNALKLHSGFGGEFDANLMFSRRFGIELSVGASSHRLCVSRGDWGEIDAGNSTFTVAEGAFFNYNLANHGGSVYGSTTHNPPWIRALLEASIAAVEDEYGVSAP